MLIVTVQAPITDGWPAAVTAPGAEVINDSSVGRTSSTGSSSRHQRLSAGGAAAPVTSNSSSARGGDQEYRDQEDIEGADVH